MNLKKFIKKIITNLKNSLLKQVYKLIPFMTYKEHYKINKISTLQQTGGIKPVSSAF